MSAPSAIAVGDVIHNGRAGKPIGAAGERRERLRREKTASRELAHVDEKKH